MRISGVEQLAAKLSSELKEPAPGFLPTIGEWARRYNVCYRTMWNAVKVLRKRGLIVIRKGSSPRRPGRTSGLTTAQQHVYDDFKTDIVEGHYKTGDMLPKYEFLQRTANVSRDTIVAALRMLSTEGLVHKKGKKWFAGPSKDRKGPASVSSRSRPVVLLLIGAELDWEMIFNSDFLKPFVELFRNELSKHGLHLSVHFSDRPLQATAALIPSGQDQAREIVAGLGDRYRGAIAVDFSQKAEEFRTRVRILSISGRKPFVLFDSSGSHQSLVRANLLSTLTYYRLFLDEASGIDIAVNSLLRAGHRTLGVLSFKQDEESWAEGHPCARPASREAAARTRRSPARLRLLRSRMCLTHTAC
jgi:DNA-binding transcriptional regulator YhcF (GntR family)